MQPDQLATLVAIVETGTFEAAARRLHVTTSAVSQRIRALESAVGQVVVVRAVPCVPTAAGETLVRLARQSALLLDEAREALDGVSGSRIDLAVAVNADSLATWFRSVVGAVAGWPGAQLRLFVEDQAFSADLLRRGEVLAAVTSDPSPVQGCSVERLGVIRYRAAATPDLVAAAAAGGGVPMVVFNEKDTLQHDVLAAAGLPGPEVVHRVPTSADFYEAVRLGLGWGMLPDAQLDPDLAAGHLALLGPSSPGTSLDVELHWQRWRLDSPSLARLTDAVRAAARALLRP